MEDEPVLGGEPRLSQGDSLKMDLYFWLQAAVMALVSLILIFTLIGRVIGVDGTSMLPTLHDGDMILLQSIGYELKRGDVVVLTKADSFIPQPLVKRVIALGGQTVRVDYDMGLVYVDGAPLDEPYVREMMHEIGGLMTNLNITVPEGSIYVMGDNRNASTDSRDIRLGTIDERCVLGRAVFVLFPLGDLGRIQ